MKLSRKQVAFAAVTALALGINVKAYAEPSFGAPMGAPAINDGVQFETSAERQIRLEADLRRDELDERVQEFDKKKLDRSINPKYQGY